MRATLAVLLRYWDIWAFSGNYGVTDVIEHKIVLEPGTRPIHERYRPPNPLLEESMKKQLNLWIKHKVIEKSNSPWNFSLVAAISKSYIQTSQLIFLTRMKIWGHPYLFFKITYKLSSSLQKKEVRKMNTKVQKVRCNTFPNGSLGKVRWCTDWRSLNRVTIKVSRKN